MTNMRTIRFTIINLWVATAVFLTTIFLYCALTILYVSPDNPVRGMYSQECAVFEIMCYQKWTFFAPPPTSNAALYMTVKNSNTGEMSIFELLAEIADAKRGALPFNTGEEITDYVVTGAVDQLNRYMVAQNTRFKGLGVGKVVKKNANNIDPNLDMAALRTLKAVAAKVLMRRNIDPKSVQVSLEARRKPMQPPALFWKGLTSKTPDILSWKCGWFTVKGDFNE